MAINQKTRKRALRALLALTAVGGIASFAAYFDTGRVNAACVAPSNDYGSTSYSISVPAAGNYRLWSRIMAPDTTNNSYMIEIDGSSCYTVGDNSITPNTWTWVDYQNAASSSKITANLSAGPHSIKFIGREASVKVDRVLAVTDTACSPAGTGDNCAVASDTAAPTVSITTPADNVNVSGTTTVTATATDDKAVNKVEFYVNNILQTTDTSLPYSFSWATQNLSNGSYTIAVKAYDAAGNVGSDTNTVTVKNGDTQAPTKPSGLTAAANAYNKVTVSWQASTDNVGVTGYTVTRSGGSSVVNTVSNSTTYTDNSVAANTQYSYKVSAFDAAGNISAISDGVSATTPSAPGDTQAPTAPASLVATPVGASQINLVWQASTDNIGVSSYDIYRATGTVATKVASVSSTSYGDSGLNASTTYNYYVVAKDAAGNVSAHSQDVSAKTGSTPPPATSKNVVRGVVRDSRRHAISNVRVTLASSGHTYYATTNSEGVYRLEGVAVGNYSIKYKINGYQTETDHVRVTGKRDVIKNVRLTKNNSRRSFWNWWG